MYQNVINYTTMNPKKLFLLDGFGALLSAFLLGVILTRFENTFGMPANALYFLAFLPCIFALYDFSCYLKLAKNQGSFLRVIAMANLVYCCISIGLMIQHFSSLTPLGLSYFVVEIAIIIFLAFIELKTAAKLIQENI